MSLFSTGISSSPSYIAKLVTDDIQATDSYDLNTINSIGGPGILVKGDTLVWSSGATNTLSVDMTDINFVGDNTFKIQFTFNAQVNNNSNHLLMKINNLTGSTNDYLSFASPQDESEKDQLGMRIINPSSANAHIGSCIVDLTIGSQYCYCGGQGVMFDSADFTATINYSGGWAFKPASPLTNGLESLDFAPSSTQHTGWNVTYRIWAF